MPTFWGSNEVALQVFSLAPHSDRHPISASLHCQLSGQPTRSAVHTSINILKGSSRSLITYDSCQHCTCLSSRLDLSRLAFCCYVVREYVAPSCILHSISCSIIHDNPHDACPSVLTLHSRTCMHWIACMRSLYCLYNICAC